MTGQFVVGYTMDPDAGCDRPGEERSGGDTSDASEERLDRVEDACEADIDLWAGGPVDGWVDGWGLPEAHVLLGLTILALAVTRLAWRRYDGLPPWSEHLSGGQRRVSHWTERSLLTLLFVLPGSGLLLLVTGDDAWLPFHIAAHITFFVTLAVHVVGNLRPRILRRML